jgi:putative spermidine/putrescine transport system substrate-binding protein
MKRRLFLTSAVGLSLAQMLQGCAGKNRDALSVRLLQGSIPVQILNAFQKSVRGSSLDFVSEAQLQNLFVWLQTWNPQKEKSEKKSLGLPDWVPLVGNSGASENRSSSSLPELVTLGDYWLKAAIDQHLIQPFPTQFPDQIPAWKMLSQNPQWQTLVRRSDRGLPDPKGQLWGVPYRWGSTVIAYRKDILKQKGLEPPTDWKDLWRSEFRQQISLLDQPREVIGLTLKALGLSYNTADLKAVSGLESKLRALHQQVKLYSSNAYLQPLLLGDTWVAVGWSTDLLSLMQRNSEIQAVFPRSGTALWADLWVRPVAETGNLSSLAQQWLKFCWKQDIATRLSLLSWATAPAILTQPPAEIEADLRRNPVLLPPQASLEASEFLQPLAETTVRQYRELWETLR